MMVYASWGGALWLAPGFRGQGGGSGLECSLGVVDSACVTHVQHSSYRDEKRRL